LLLADRGRVSTAGKDSRNVIRNSVCRNDSNAIAFFDRDPVLQIKRFVDRLCLGGTSNWIEVQLMNKLVKF
jgi:hypothetical protein